jgi:predicted thioesterase
MAVRATATLRETDGRRFLFHVEAWDAREKIAEGRHERFVVGDLAKFLDRAAKKGA